MIVLLDPLSMDLPVLFVLAAGNALKRPAAPKKISLAAAVGP